VSQINNGLVKSLHQRIPLPHPERSWVRISLVVSGLVCLGLLLTARLLTPNPNGLGTHEQLGLPECGFLLMFEIPCPSCGMTTSWAWLTRGDVVESLRSNPGGTMLGILCFGFGIWMLISGIRSRWLIGVPSTFWITILFGVTVLVTLIQWLNQIWG
jgi:hypothetical protein